MLPEAATASGDAQCPCLLLSSQSTLDASRHCARASASRHGERGEPATRTRHRFVSTRQARRYGESNSQALASDPASQALARRLGPGIAVSCPATRTRHRSQLPGDSGPSGSVSRPLSVTRIKIVRGPAPVIAGRLTAGRHPSLRED